MNNVSRQTARRNARTKALQALYQWDLNEEAQNSVSIDTTIKLILEQFHDSQDMSKVDLEYFTELFGQTLRSKQKLDEELQPSLDRPVADVDPIERCICRLGAYELANRLDIPMKVVINEWVEITKKFGSDKGYKYINGVMDKLGQRLRTLEAGLNKKGETGDSTKAG